MQPCEVFLAAWGGLAGFVGWASCFRMIAPVSDWLLEGRIQSNLASGLVRVLVLVFGLLAMLLIIILPVSVNSAESCDLASREVFGVAFVSSMLGLAALGLIRRLMRPNRDDSSAK